MENYWKEYWKDFAEAFAHPITTNGLIGKFVTNPAVTGLYAEAAIRRLLSSMLPNYRVSNGAIIKCSDRLKDLRKIPQCDLIIWDPTELPALFEKDNFALVPNLSVRAIIEVKRTYQNLKKFQEQLKRQQKCLIHKYKKNILGVVLTNSKALYNKTDINENWPMNKAYDDEITITRILTNKSKKIDFEGVLVLIYFISYVARIHHNLLLSKIEDIKSEFNTHINLIYQHIDNNKL